MNHDLLKVERALRGEEFITKENRVCLTNFIPKYFLRIFSDSRQAGVCVANVIQNDFEIIVYSQNNGLMLEFVSMNKIGVKNFAKVFYSFEQEKFVTIE